MAMLSTRKRTPRRGGIARRQQLLQAARDLLGERELDDISLGDVAAAAGVPKSSAYHFYADIRDLYASLLSVIQQELLAALQVPIRTRVRDWQHIVQLLTRRGANFYTRNHAALRLQIGPQVPPELKLHDRRNDAALAQIHERHIDRHFVLPPVPQRTEVFFRAVGIADLMFTLSVLEHGRITADMAAEASKATCAYLACYVPAELPRRGRPDDDRS